MNIREARKYGKCSLCKAEDVPVKQYKGNDYHWYCLDIQRDKDRAKTSMRHKKGYEDFRSLLRRLF